MRARNALEAAQPEPPQIGFEWDDVKAHSNIRKHGISFNEAETVFETGEILILPDTKHSEIEVRFHAIGYSSQSRILLISHVNRENDSIRIISVRKANNKEKKAYNEKFSQRT